MALTLRRRGLATHLVHARMDDESLVQRRTYSAVRPVLEIQLLAPPDDVAEQVTEDGGVLRQQGLEVEGALGRHELCEPYLSWRDLGPVGQRQAMGWIGTAVPHPFEDHSAESRTGP